MINKTLLLFFFSLSIVFSQDNSKVDSLGVEIDVLKRNIAELKGQIQAEITQTGFLLTVDKKYSFSKLLLKDKKYGEVIDTLKVGEKIKIIGKEIGVYKVEYNEKIGFVDDSDLKIEDNSNLKYLEYKDVSHSSSSSKMSSYVRGHYRKTKSGKRVFVKGHKRKK